MTSHAERAPTYSPRRLQNSALRNLRSVAVVVLIGLVSAESLHAAPTANAPNAAAAARDSKDQKEQLTRMPSADALRPSGPVTITARRAELVQGDSAVYTGNVQLSSNTLKMDGDRLEIKQHPDGNYEAHITGNPGHLSHIGTGADDPSVAAHARTLVYDSRTGVVDLLGDALFKRGDDQITGDTIHYNLDQRRIQADGGEGDRQIQIILQAPPPVAPHTNKAPSSAPAASDAAAPAPTPAAPAATPTAPSDAESATP